MTCSSLRRGPATSSMLTSADPLTCICGRYARSRVPHVLNAPGGSTLCPTRDYGSTATLGVTQNLSHTGYMGHRELHALKFHCLHADELEGLKK